MCILHIYAQCYNKFFEVSPDEPDLAELIVEDAVCRVLLDLFGVGTVEDVSIEFPPKLRMGLRYCAIQIVAQCACQRFSQLPRTQEHIKMAIEKNLTSLLRELFGVVSVESVIVGPAWLEDRTERMQTSCIYNDAGSSPRSQRGLSSPVSDFGSDPLY